MLRLLVINILLLRVLLFGFPAFAQTNPTPAACGFPTGGDIVADVIYTLTANCTQSATVSLASDIDLTIIGNGYTIDGYALSLEDRILYQLQGGAMTISDVTFLGGGYAPYAVIRVGNNNLTITNVTFRDYWDIALDISGTNPTATLTNVLFEDAEGWYNGLTSYPTVFRIVNGANVTATNVVIRDVYRGNAAIYVGYAGSLTLNGCLTMQRVFPRKFHIDTGIYAGALTDNSTGECSGTIGNGDPAIYLVSEPEVSACGLPLGGFVSVSRSYSLTADCVLSSILHFPTGVAAVINANGHTISSMGNKHLFLIADDFVLDGAILTGTTGFPVMGFLDDSTLTVRNSIIRNTEPFFLTGTDAVFENVLLDGMTSYRVPAVAGRASVFTLRHNANLTLRDTIIRNASGGGAAFTFRGANLSITLEGCITFENILPMIYRFTGTTSLANTVIDNSTGPCTALSEREILPISSARSPLPSSAPQNRQIYLLSSLCASRDGIEAIPLGSIACIFRARVAGETVLAIYGVNDQSVGFHLLTAYQSQLNAAVGETIIAVSPVGRALVVMWTDRNVTIKVGPDHEGKILHLTLDQSLHGSAIGLITTYGAAPGLPYLSNFGHVPASAAADTAERPLQGCQVTTTDYVNFRRVPSGQIMTTLTPGYTLSANARTGGWFKVNYDGNSGWISAGYVTTQGACA